MPTSQRGLYEVIEKTIPTVTAETFRQGAHLRICGRRREQSVMPHLFSWDLSGAAKVHKTFVSCKSRQRWRQRLYQGRST